MSGHTKIRPPPWHTSFLVVEKPWDKMVLQQGNVDWFDFWLNGKEDSDPAKAEQYKRWREFRKLQQRQTAGQKPN